MLHDDIDTLTIVAGGLLTGAPLHTIPTGDTTNETWIDRWTVRHIPSRSNLQDPHRSHGATIVLADPTNSLPNGAIAPAIVHQWDPDATIAPDGANRAWLLEHLPAACNLDLSCHARSTPGDPFAFGFDLGDPLLLSLADLLATNLARLDLAVIPACGSGQVAAGAPDEPLGLGYGMLYAGAGSVITSLWNADDFATTLILHAFYQQLKTEPPDRALRAAQLWLRDLTVKDLQDMASHPTPLGERIQHESATLISLPGPGQQAPRCAVSTTGAGSPTSQPMSHNTQDLVSLRQLSPASSGQLIYRHSSTGVSDSMPLMSIPTNVPSSSAKNKAAGLSDAPLSSGSLAELLAGSY